MKLLSRLASSRRAIVGVVVGILALGAGVGAFASQDALPLVQLGDDPVAQAVELQDEGDGNTADDGDENGDGGRRDIVGIPEDHPKHGPDVDDGDCEKWETTIKETPSGNQVRVPCHAVEHGQRDVVGIPEDNPQHADGDANDNDECDKGETVIKETPSGKQVRVPCHAVERGPPSFSNAHTADGEDQE